MVRVRSAVLEDIDLIMVLEEEAFGAVSKEAMASRATMLHRINLLNKGEIKWYWVAEYGDKIVGYMIMQPTDITPEKCSSWHMATDSGTLNKTFNPNGENLYGVSLAISDSAPNGVMELLMHCQFIVWLRGRQKHFMICSRMPGYRAICATMQITPEEYWQMKSPDGTYFDGMLHYFSEFVGVAPVRLLPAGFPEDEDSCGYGVLCVGNDPWTALHQNLLQIEKAGLELSWFIKDKELIEKERS